MKKHVTMLACGVATLMLATSCKKEGATSAGPSQNAANVNQTEALSPNSAQSSYVYSTSDNFGSYTPGGNYAAYNDAWGTGTDHTQTLNCYSTTHWNVVTNQPSGGNPVKTYPHSTDQVAKQISSLNTCTSDFNYSVPSSWTGDRAYDIWAGSSDKYEIMVWMGRNNNFNPLCDNYDANGAVPSYTNVNVGGHTFNVYHKYNSSSGKYVFTFLRTSNLSSGTVDIKAILNWIRYTPHWMNDEVLNRIEFGFEIGVGNGTWTLNSFSTNVN